MTAPRTNRKERRADDILNAAERMIRANGLSGFTARSVTEAAGCSLGTLYTCFDDIDDLVLAVNSRTLSRLGRALKDTDMAHAPESTERKLIAFATTYLLFATENRQAWGTLFDHRMANGRPLPDWHLDEHLGLIGILDGPVHDLLPDMDAVARDLLCRSLFSAVHGMVALGLQSRMGSIPVDVLRGEIAIIVSAMTRGLCEPS